MLRTPRNSASWARLAAGTCVSLGMLLGASSSAAESAWVSGEIRLNLRTGPGIQYRIVGVLTTGEGVQVLQRAEKWTQVRMPDGKQGWIPGGRLQAEPPPTVRLIQLEEETTELSSKLEAITSQRDGLQETNATLSANDSEQSSEVDRLTRENMELRAGARWPEWITGASVLSVGMILGALLHRSSARRPGPRIRL